MTKFKAPTFSLKLWHFLLGGVLAFALLVHLICGSALFGNSVGITQRTAQAPQFPSQFQVRHVLLSPLSHRFNVQTKDNPDMGRIDEQFISWGKTFKLYNSAGEQFAVAHQRVVAWGTTLDVLDGAGKTKIATLEKRIVQSVFKQFTVYRILGPDGQVIGESDKVDLFVTEFDIYDAQHQLVLTLVRPWINWPTDLWEVKIYGGTINPVVAEVIAVYKSAADAEH